ncbi:uncharacterized protein LOC129742919 [Uranotaenia lowii]|uniref:uncharacterized protein LOC129742919 n=1 Tax=Uranotaenia lowii TaxID=190385 RepID=UPI00247ACEAF|nr:uncharacterized protein LOC129742919 [Uranotaenia lowii]
MNLSTVEDYRLRSSYVLDPISFGYINGAAGEEQTHQLNSSSYNRIRIRPRQLMDVGSRQMSRTILGQHFSMPVGISPTALQKLAHKDGERATVRAAAKFGIPFVMSSMASSTIDQVAQAAPEGVRWMQTYLHRNRNIARTLVEQAERNGFTALVLTIDSPVLGIMNNQVRSGNIPNDARFEVFRDFARQGVITNGDDIRIVADFDQSLTWKDVEWLMSITKLPVIVKGVLTKEDAIRAVETGVAAILVSNHGGRQLDSIPATIEALPEIASVVKGRIPILMDGGISKGTDIFKALAYGADMVFMGRTILWGLAVGGQQGVEDVLEILRNEFDNAMALAGCSSLSEIGRDRVMHEEEYNASALVSAFKNLNVY